MGITHDDDEFTRVTGMIEEFERLRTLGLSANLYDGSFWPEGVDDVLHFCECNPRFHIISFFGDGIFVNRYDPRGKLFFLADGDPNPAHTLDLRHFYDWTGLSSIRLEK